MEVPGGSENKGFVCLFEAVGTAILILGINMSGGNALCVGLFLLMGIAMLGPISGGHFNPAVSLGVLFKEGKTENMGFFFLIMLSQVGGALAGVLISALTQFHNPDTDRMEPGFAKLCPGEGLAAVGDDGNLLCEPASPRAALTMFVAEALATFLFVSVVLSVKYVHKGPDEAKFFMVVVTLVALATAIGPISGAAINPAIGFVQPVFQNIMQQAGVEEGDNIATSASMWISIIGPFAGALLAAAW